MLSSRAWKQTSAELLACLLLFVFVAGLAQFLLPEPVVTGEASPFVRHWWAGLCGLASLNLGLWVVSARAFRLRQAELGALFSSRRFQLVLSAIYVVGCAQRSYWPKVDVQRFCLVDSWLSSVFVGRTIATVAELAFAAQWALLLREYSNEARFSFGRTVSALLFPMIAVAQCCCWYSVLTTSFLGHICEESLWATAAALLTISVAYLWRHAASSRGFLGCVLAFGLCYVGYMVTVDIPMYVIRFLADRASGREPLTLLAGLHDVIGRRVVTHRWADWASEISWLTLYFSLAVWASVACAHVPRYAKARDL